MNTDKIDVLIVGATGRLGSLVTKHCLTKPNLTVSIFIRDPHKNEDLVSQVKNAGGKVIIGDVTKPDTIKGITKGMHTVIFTTPPFGEEVTVDGQIAMIKDCIDNNVKRVVPAEYAKGTAKISPEEIKLLPPLYSKMRVRDYLKNAPIKALRVNTGLFLDSLLKVLLTKEFGYWGDAYTKIDLTSYEDTAKVIAAAVAKEDRVGDVAFVGYKASLKEVVDAYNKARGTYFVPEKLGSLGDLMAKAEEAEKKNDPNGVWQCCQKLQGNVATNLARNLANKSCQKTCKKIKTCKKTCKISCKKVENCKKTRKKLASKVKSCNKNL